MKVLLVKPYNLSDHIQPSLGLGYLATSVRKTHDVKILDCIKEGMKIDKLGNFIRRSNPDLLGLQCYTFDLKFVREALRSAKRIRREIITVVGGPHPSSIPRDMMEDFRGDIDFLFAGEAEIGFAKLLDSLDAGKNDLSSIGGLVWHNKNGALISNQREFVEDLDSLGLPAWDLIRPDTYPESQHGAFFKKFPIAPIMLTRGCPYPCTFCAGGIISGKRIRRRSIDHVLNEMLLLYEDFGIREFHIVDDNFTLDISYVKEFLKRLKDLNLDISWAVPNGIRMDALDEEVLKLMKDTGLYLISLGIESGSDEVLRQMKKGIMTAKIRSCVKMISDSGIDIAGFFILGFPGETEETIRETIHFSLKLGLTRANFFTYLPFPGTESYQELEAKGELKDVDWEHFAFFTAAYTPVGLSRKRLKSLQRLAFAKFYLRPRIILYHIKSIKSFRHFLYLARRFFRWFVF